MRLEPLRRSVDETRVSFAIVAIMLIALVAGGCAYSNVSSHAGPASYRVPEVGARIGVVVADDPDSADPGAGRVLSDLTVDAVQRRFPSCNIVEAAGEADAFKRAAKDGFAYLFFPKIERWGNSIGLQSGLREPVVIELRLMLVKTREQVRTVRFEGRNNSVTIGSRVPEALTDEDYPEAVQRLLIRNGD